MKHCIISIIVLIFISTALYANPILFLVNQNDGSIVVPFLKIQALWNSDPQLDLNILDISVNDEKKNIVVSFMKNKRTSIDFSSSAVQLQLKKKTIDLFRNAFPFVPLRFNWNKVIDISISDVKKSITTQTRRPTGMLSKIIVRDNISNLEVAVAQYAVMWSTYYSNILPFIVLSDAQYNSKTKKTVFKYTLDEQHPEWKSFERQFGIKDGMTRFEVMTLEFFTNTFPQIPETFNWKKLIRIEVYSKQSKKVIAFYQNGVTKIVE